MINLFHHSFPRKILRKGLTSGEHFYFKYLYSSPELRNRPVPGKYLIFGGEHRGDIKDEYSTLYSADCVKDKIREADLICDHVFNILGSGPKKLSAEGAGYQPIDWHCDYKSGYRWDPKTFNRNIRVGHKAGVDIKIPWELSRFQHLHVLGQAYHLTGNKRYSDEIARQIDDWIRNNPYCFGANWRCAMDVAIRAVNWLVAMEYFADENLLPKKFLDYFYGSIREHGKFIRGNLEYAGQWTTNHYLADIAGLFFIALYCPFLKESSDWQKFAYAELHKEMEKQVYPDGCCFESSTSYHRLSLEIFFYAALLGKRAGIEFCDAYNDALKKMFDFSLHCMKPDGMIPQIGDNDSGRFLKFSDRPVLDHRYLLSLAAVHFNDENFKLEGPTFDDEAYWVFGIKGAEGYAKLPFRNGPLQSRAFPNAGWYIIRNDKDYCFISCGPNGGDGWHSHNDKLSFELVINGQDVVVDPGTYVYTSGPEERNKFRSTEYHNTIKFEGHEQNDIPGKIMFSLPDKVNILNAGLNEDSGKITFKGEIGYKNIRHKRTITLNKMSFEWRITDSISCPHAMNARLSFHLSPEIMTDGNVLMTNTGQTKIASIDVEDYKLNKEEYDYSPEYGVKKKAECVAANIHMMTTGLTITTHVRSLL